MQWSIGNGVIAYVSYVPWNIHEPQPLTYDFIGQQNLSAFLLTAQEAGLVVILRAGPYICGEWEYVSSIFLLLFTYLFTYLAGYSLIVCIFTELFADVFVTSLHGHPDRLQYTGLACSFLFVCPSFCLVFASKSTKSHRKAEIAVKFPLGRSSLCTKFQQGQV